MYMIIYIFTMYIFVSIPYGIKIQIYKYTMYISRTLKIFIYKLCHQIKINYFNKIILKIK